GAAAPGDVSIQAESAVACSPNETSGTRTRNSPLTRSTPRASVTRRGGTRPSHDGWACNGDQQPSNVSTARLALRKLINFAPLLDRRLGDRSVHQTQAPLIRRHHVHVRPVVRLVVGVGRRHIVVHGA